MKYYKLSRNYSNNILIPETEDIYSHITDWNSPWFTSMFYYSEEHYKQFQQTDSLKGIKDNFTNKLWFDFDSEADLELARKDTLLLLERLYNHDLDETNTQISFSGQKGFSVIVTITDTLKQEQVKAIWEELTHDLTTRDPKMYDNQRIFRLLFTRHEETGLYKTPLNYNELVDWTIDEIKAMSKDLVHKDFIKEVLGYYKPFTLTQYFNNIKDLAIEPKREPNQLQVVEDIWSKKPKDWKNCKWSLLQGQFEPGDRHMALMVVAATARGKGFDKQSTYYLCKSALKKQAEIHNQEEFSTDELWTNIIEQSTFGPDWKGGQYDCKKDPWLAQYCKGLGDHACRNSEQPDALKPKKIADLTKDFKEFANNIEANTVKTGIRELDEYISITTGTHVGILAGAGSGKTTCALNILNNTSKAEIHTVFASLDMHPNRMYQKAVQKVCRQTGKNVIDAYKNGREADYVKKLKEEFGNVWFFDRSSPTVQDIREYILKCQEESGEKIKLLVLDYFERVNSDFNDETQGSKRIAGELQDLIKDLNIAIITLVQPTKEGIKGGIDAPIYDYTKIKGSSFIYQSFRVIMSLWRPFNTAHLKNDDRFIQMALLKNDLGELGEFEFGWDGANSEIYELDDHQRRELKDLLEIKKLAQTPVNEWD